MAEVQDPFEVLMAQESNIGEQNPIIPETEPVIEKEKIESKEVKTDNQEAADYLKSLSGEDKKEEFSSDVESFIKSFGDYDKNTFAEKFKTLSSVEKKFQEEKIVLEQKLKEYEGRIEEEKSKQSLYITDDKLAKLNILKNKGVEDFDIYATLAIKGKEGIDPMSIISQDMKKKYPDLSDARIEKMINKQYGLNTPKPEYDDDIDDYETELAINKSRLKADANAIISKYESELDAVELPYKQEKGDDATAAIVNKAKAKETWTPYMDTFVSTVGNFTQDIEIDGEKVSIPFSLTPDEVKKYSDIINGFVYDNGIPLSKDTYANVAEVAKTLIIKDSLPKILKSTYDAAIKRANSDWEARVNGEGIAYKQTPKGAPAGSHSEAFNKLMGQSIY